ncbi:MAG: hypothetical protein LBD76_05365 [Prevotellaceae bacterium]|jgi:hypothetical protein|nr:hypothetical protein [Prevotellaceae bacterium]
MKGDGKIIDDIFETEQKKGVNYSLLERYNGNFDKAVSSAFGKDFPGLANDLRLNASKFATYKSYKLTENLHALKKKYADNKPEFERQAKLLISLQNSYALTEANTMIARARTAKQFENFKSQNERNPDLYPNLEWLTSTSVNQRELHQSFTGTVLPINDRFWQDNQPGNLYNCKCNWRLTDKNVTTTPDNVSPAPGLDGNPADTHELFTNKHPYFNPDKHVKELPDKMLDHIAKLMPPDEVVFAKNPDGFLEHILLSDSDKINRDMAKILVDNGYKDVKLLPQINATDTFLRERYFGKLYAKTHYAKNPDAIINGEIWEFKNIGSKYMSRQTKEAAAQADIIFVKSKEVLTTTDINRFLKDQWTLTDRLNIKEIVFYNDGKLYNFKRGQFM